MNKRLLIAFAIIALVGYGCAAQWPTCNDRFVPDAKLRQIADKYQLCLDNIGNSLILANGVAISLAKAYTAQEALAAVDKISFALQQPMSGIDIKALIMKEMGAFPELFIITDVFVGEFNTPELVDAESVAILLSYLQDRVRPILVQRIEFAKE